MTWNSLHLTQPHRLRTMNVYSNKNKANSLSLEAIKNRQYVASLATLLLLSMALHYYYILQSTHPSPVHNRNNTVSLRRVNWFSAQSKQKRNWIWYGEAAIQFECI